MYICMVICNQAHHFGVHSCFNSAGIQHFFHSFLVPTCFHLYISGPPFFSGRRPLGSGHQCRQPSSVLAHALADRRVYLGTGELFVALDGFWPSFLKGLLGITIDTFFLGISGKYYWI